MTKDKKREEVKEDFSFFDIDEFNLDKEWIAQPALFFAWARKLADTRLEMDECKAELDVVRAEAGRAIRDDPGEYGYEKVTEAIVAAAVNEHPDVTAATKRLFECRHKHEVVQAAVNALEHRKRALENLVDLHGQNYFSTPRTPNTEAGARLEEAGKRHVRQKGQRPKERNDGEE